jgi:hypothetical protein
MNPLHVFDAPAGSRAETVFALVQLASHLEVGQTICHRSNPLNSTGKDAGHLEKPGILRLGSNDSDGTEKLNEG